MSSPAEECGCASATELGRDVAGSEFRGVFFFFLRVPGGVNRVTRESIDPKPRGAFFLSIYVTPDLSLTGRLPLSVAQTVPQSPVYSLRSGGFSGFKFTVKPDMLRLSRSRSEAKTLSGSAVFFICVCYAIMCDLVESSLELCLFC